MAAWEEQPADGFGECAALVGSAEALRFSAPELAVQLARRALVVGAAAHRDKGGDSAEARTLSMRAQAVLTGGLVRISRYVDAVEPGFAALALAESGGAAEVAISVRLDLAACSREVGEPLLGCSLLRPVFDESRPSVRAMALGRLVACTWHVSRRDDVEDALAEVERLISADDELSPDARRVERARLSARAAAYNRWYGDIEDTADAAREGLRHLARLSDRQPESDRLRAQLVLELVFALLDDGELTEAAAESEAVLAEPVRATSAAAVGQLMLAVSTRVHLPAGQVARGRALLDEAVRVAERHRLDGLLADALTSVSQLDEQAGRPADALEALRTARAAEERRLRAFARASRRIVTDTGARDWDAHAVNSLLRKVLRPAEQSVAAPAAEPVATVTPVAAPGELASSAVGAGPCRDDTDEATGLLNREGLFRRLRAVRNGERPVALTLIRFENDGAAREDGPGRAIDIDLEALAGRVRDLAPDDAELARPDGSELAVVLPHTTRDQAECFAAAIRESAMGSNWLGRGAGRTISTGVAQSNPHVQAVDARALLTAARHALTPTAPGPKTPPAPENDSPELADTIDTLRIGRAIINSLTAPPAQGGKRRAKDDAPAPTTPADPATTDGRVAPNPSAPTHTPPAATPRVEPTPADFNPLSAGISRPTTNPSDPTNAPGEPQQLGTTHPSAATGSPGAVPPAAAFNPPSSPHSPNGPRPAGASSVNAADRTTGPHPATTSDGAVTSGGAVEPRSASAADRTGGIQPASAADPGGVHHPTNAVEPGTAAHSGGMARSGDQSARPAGETSADDATSGDEKWSRGGSNYERTKAELARLMSALIAGETSDRFAGETPDRSAAGTPSEVSARSEPAGTTHPHRDEPLVAVEEPAGGSVEARDDSIGSTYSKLFAVRDRGGAAEPTGAAHGERPAEPAPDRNGSAVGRPNSTPAKQDEEPTKQDEEPTKRDEDSAKPDEPGSSDTGGARSWESALFGRRPSAVNGSANPARDTPASRPEPVGRWDRRAERSSGSTTIAGLLAEALAAYQETSESGERTADGVVEAEPAARRNGQPGPGWARSAERPDQAESSGLDDFDRLFDWRRESPASGRHRSPE